MSTSRGVVEHYERYWREGLWADNPYERWKLEHVRAHVAAARHGARVLDVGCGGGHMLEALAPLGVHGLGVDLSSAAVEQAGARGIRAMVADIENGALPADSGEFDVVLCLDVLEHLFFPERLLGEMARVLAPHGQLVVAVPNGLNLFNRLAFAAGRHLDVMDKAHLSASPFSEHLRFFSHGVLESTLSAAGFVVKERHYFFPDRFTDARFRLAGWLAQAVTRPRLHERRPSLFALEFLYVCDRAR